MNSSNRCTTCHAVTPAEPLSEGLCPACLVRDALDLGSVASGQLQHGASQDAPPATIGPYRLLQKLGEGGMGIVYLAEQTRPMRRRVALKLLKPGMDTEQVLARFDSERQAMALMNHACVAQALDAGATEDGRPYFVMEYVDGPPITEFCDDQQLDLRARLELFHEVCLGVHHAHQRAIIHRDVKPSNVLVCLEAGRPVPKIIDFGVAKAMVPGGLGNPDLTELGQTIGTPASMSPEQAGRAPHQVDVRTDVHALGGLLYELLCGSPPFQPQDSDPTLDELRRRIREDEPRRPSSRFTAAVNAQQVAAARRSNVPTLERNLRGDLDWICIKCLEKEPSRRYQSAADLAADIGRHLQHHPVFAGPPSAVYRARKFARRHRVAVVACGLIVLAIVVGGLAGASGLLRARSEARNAKQVSDFLVELFEAADPDRGAGNTLTALEMLDQGVRRLNEGPLDAPQVRARVLHTLGTGYVRLGAYEQAQQLLSDALRLRTASLGSEAIEVAQTLRELGVVAQATGDVQAAAAYYERALAIYEPGEVTGTGKSKPVEGGQAIGSPAVANLLDDLAGLSMDAGRRDDAAQRYHRAFEIRQTTLPAGHPDLARSLGNLARIALQSSEPEVAVARYTRALAIAEVALGTDHPLVADTLAESAVALTRLGQFETARQHHERALHLRQQLLGPEHPRVADSMHGLARLAWRSGERQRADELFAQAVGICERSQGPNHPALAAVLDDWATMLFDWGRCPAARPLYQRAVAIREQAYGANDPGVARSLHHLGNLLRCTGEVELARDALERALTIRQSNFGGEHPDIALSLSGLAELASDTGDLERGQQLGWQAVEMLERWFGSGHTRLLPALETLVRISRAHGQEQTARDLESRVAAIRDR